jgi:heme/copper-type cytochrome/quinol oxidase subunit 2
MAEEQRQDKFLLKTIIFIAIAALLVGAILIVFAIFIIRRMNKGDQRE